MTRHRVTVTLVTEFDVIPEHYGDAASDEERAEIDRVAFDLDPSLILEADLVSDDVSVEILP